MKKLTILFLASILASCGGGGGGSPSTAAYIFNQMGIEPGGAAVSSVAGFNLDGAPGGSGMCTMQRDYTNANGPDIDNGFSTLYGLQQATLDGVIGSNLTTYLTNQLSSGAFQVILRLTDVSSYTADSDVGVEIFVTPTVTIPRDSLSGGRIAAGKTWAVSTSNRVAMVRGAIVNGRLSATINSFTLTISTMGITIPLELTGARIAGNVTATTFTGGMIGGWVSVQAVKDNPLVSSSSLAGVVGGLLDANADGRPNAGGMCQDISLGATAEGVSATLTGI